MTLLVDYASIDENHPPDFAAARAYGIRGAIVRGAFTFKGSCFVDPCVARDRDAIGAADLHFGSYLILGWTVEPELQARKFIEAFGERRPGDLPPSLDIEFPGNGIRDYRLTASEALQRIETALGVLVAEYGTVMIYTSNRVWTEDLADIDSLACGACPGWFKVAYSFAAGHEPRPDVVPPLGTLPKPWRNGGPGCWLEQFQGDARGVPGFSSTVDLNVFRPFSIHAPDARASWMVGAVQRHNAATVEDFQASVGLEQDGVVGISTFSALTLP